MGVWADFKQFAFKGNAIDLAVGVVIGSAFTGIVNGLVNGIFMPIVSLVLPHGGWQQAVFTLKRDPVDPAKDVVLQYGQVLASILNFFAIAFVLFIIVSKIVKAAEGKLSKPQEATNPASRPRPVAALLVWVSEHCRATPTTSPSRPRAP